MFLTKKLNKRTGPQKSIMRGITIGEIIINPRIIKNRRMYILHFARPDMLLFCIPAHPKGFKGLK